MRKIILVILLLLTSLQAQEKAFEDEINHLLNYVEKENCVYIRNGDRHNSKEARKHIQRKYDYFEDDVKSTEDFIRLSATESTMFGNKYYIQCQDKAKVLSSQWLLDELARYRKSHKSQKGK
jgi:hypothetical protein